VFLREPAGFDAIVANPPWEEVNVEELSFYTRYIPGLKSERSRDRQQTRIKEFARRHPDVQHGYEEAVDAARQLAKYLTKSFELAGGGNTDLYKAFAERFLQLCRDGGAIGVVLPR